MVVFVWVFFCWSLSFMSTTERFPCLICIIPTEGSWVLGHQSFIHIRDCGCFRHWAKIWVPLCSHRKVFLQLYLFLRDWLLSYSILWWPPVALCHSRMGQGSSWAPCVLFCFFCSLLTLTVVPTQVLRSVNAQRSHKLPVGFALQKLPLKSVFGHRQRSWIPRVSGCWEQSLFHFWQRCSTVCSLWSLPLAVLLTLRKERAGNHRMVVPTELAVALPSH